MRHCLRYAVLPALTAASLLVVTGCAGGAPSGAPAAGRNGGGDVPPAAVENAGGGADGGGAAPLAVAAASGGSGGSGAVATPGPGRRPAATSPLRIVEFDKRSGRAVLSARPAGGTGGADKGRPGATGKPVAPVAVGDVIASAPAPGAPHGALAKVTGVVGTSARGTEVRTAPATLGAVLGGATARGRVPVDPAAVTVEPLAPKVAVSWAKTGGLRVGPEGGRLPLGSLRIDVRAALPAVRTPAGTADASAAGFVQLTPQVDFAYDGTGGATGRPGTASVSLAGDWTSRWELKGRAAAATPGGAPLRVPFATLHADPVIRVGAVPVVVNLALTCYLQVDADGKVSVDVSQDVKGHFRVGGAYDRATGWTPLARADLTGTPVRVTATAAGRVKAALGAEASVGLYGSVGVTGTLAPYLRAEAEGTATGASDGTGALVGKWAAYGGVDLSGALRAHLDIFGTPVFERSIPLGPLHREWPLGGGTGAVRTPAGRP
ncbi:hypothetical protein MUU72_03445 [Streptomyces sp. RS10V-4]|uniref:hypothetical protein n=1 Tax=Streptomyces rhizoryzae TaxID=2932493 RepID=UPI002006906C|nr:hypothetical protein [Streptomyces rhizoryzae]MCK7622188.1 hypothetical protein [Streptomyces rhizoryzae]